MTYVVSARASVGVISSKFCNSTSGGALSMGRGKRKTRSLQCYISRSCKILAPCLVCSGVEVVYQQGRPVLPGNVKGPYWRCLSLPPFQQCPVQPCPSLAGGGSCRRLSSWHDPCSSIAVLLFQAVLVTPGLALWSMQFPCFQEIVIQNKITKVWRGSMGL